MSEAGARWPDLAGRIEGAGHVLPVRVYFEDTDFSGLVYHASYVRWFERGRSDWLRLLGVHHRLIEEGTTTGEPAAFVVRRMSVDFLKPARIDDVLEVRTRAAGTTAATLVLEQAIGRDGTDICRARVEVLLLSRSGRVLRLSRVLPAGLLAPGS